MDQLEALAATALAAVEAHEGAEAVTFYRDFIAGGEEEAALTCVIEDYHHLLPPSLIDEAEAAFEESDDSLVRQFGLDAIKKSHVIAA